MTTVTIELTDQEVADLRQQPPYSGPGWQIPIINRICAALPPEPVSLTIELPPGLARHELFDHATYSSLGKTLTMAEAEALTAYFNLCLPVKEA